MPTHVHSLVLWPDEGGSWSSLPGRAEFHACVIVKLKRDGVKTKQNQKRTRIGYRLPIINLCRNIHIWCKSIGITAGILAESEYNCVFNEFTSVRVLRSPLGIRSPLGMRSKENLKWLNSNHYIGFKLGMHYITFLDVAWVLILTNRLVFF